MREDQQIRLLFVDDEEHNLTAFKAAFRRDFNIETCIDPKLAIELVRQKNFHVIISDQRMPGMSGIEMFGHLHEFQPDSVKILCTAYADIQVLMDALNRGHIFRFISKPWNEDELKVAIIDAYEQHQTRIKLKKSNEELLATLDELEKFIYTAAHDLRAPLLSIEGLIDLCRQLPDRQDEFFLRIHQSVKRLDDQLVKMVQYYKASNAQLDPDKIKLLDEVKLVLDSLKFLDNSEPVQVELTIPENYTMSSDRIKLRAILNNLISNALKYSDPSKSDKWIRISAASQNNGTTIVISDNGIGISEENISRIFGLFFTEGSRAKGSGLGLYIVHEAVERLDGTIDIHSQKGVGSTFSLFLPDLLQDET
jgi:two-component system, sensor histidine kinase and response regulator